MEAYFTATRQITHLMFWEKALRRKPVNYRTVVSFYSERFQGYDRVSPSGFIFHIMAQNGRTAYEIFNLVDQC